MRRFLKATKRLDPGIFKPLEWCLSRSNSLGCTSHAPMLILLAPPRSGSTFCYQAMCHRFDVNYFSNFIYMGSKYPFLSTALANRWCSKYVSDFKSNLGFVAGLNGPAEANDIWGDWFDQRLCEVSPAPTKDSLVKALSYFDWLWETTSKPFVAGWIGHILYAKQMAELFPNAIFISLERSAQDIAVSLIRARRKVNKDFGQWFSTRPNECFGQAEANPFDSVAKQVVSLQQRSAEFISHHSDRVFRLEYESLCASAEDEMLRLSNYCVDKGMRLALTSGEPQISGRVPVPRIDDDYTRVQEALARLLGARGEG